MTSNSHPADNRRFRVIFLGNAGVGFEHGGKRLYIDAYFTHAPSVGTAPVLDPDRDPWPDLLLLTHHHPDHCLPSSVQRAARRAQAAGGTMTVAGPRRALAQLAGRMPEEWLVELDPPEIAAKSVAPPESTVRDFGFATATAYRTWHGNGGHNSYLVEWDGFRLFHDGDNERTQTFDLAAMGPLDALFLCPWQGAGTEELVARWRPKHWFLIHLTDDEIEQHENGKFLPALFAAPPAVMPAAPRPGTVVALS